MDANTTDGSSLSCSLFRALISLTTNRLLTVFPLMVVYPLHAVRPALLLQA